jgi:hypothetical protein
VRALEDHLVDDPVAPDGARDQIDLGGRRQPWDEMRGVEGADLVPPDAAGHDRHVIEMGRCAHRLERGIGAVLLKLGVQVPLPDLEHGLLARRKVVLDWRRHVTSSCRLALTPLDSAVLL